MTSELKERKWPPLFLAYCIDVFWIQNNCAFGCSMPYKLFFLNLCNTSYFAVSVDDKSLAVLIWWIKANNVVWNFFKSMALYW